MRPQDAGAKAPVDPIADAPRPDQPHGRTPGRPLVGAHELATPYWARFHAQVAAAGVRSVVRAAPGTVGTLVSWAWRVSPRLTLASGGLQLLSAVAMMSGLLATADVFTRLLTAGPTPDRLVAALPGLALVGVALVARGVLLAAVAGAQAELSPQIEQRAQDDLYTALAEVDLLAFDDPDFTQLVERASRHGLVAIRQGVALVGALISAAVSAAAAIVATAFLHPVLGLLVLLTGIPQAWATLRAAQLRMASFARTTSQERRRDITGLLLSERANAAEVRAFAAQHVLLDEHRRITAQLTDEARRTGRQLNTLLTAGRAASAVCAAAGYVVLGLLVYTGRIPLALAGTAVVAMRASTPAVADGVLAANRLFESGLYIQLFRECVADIGRRSRPAPPPRCLSAPSCIELSGVSFRYPAQQRDALHEVDLTLRRGEVVALVGENGSGKTTLAKLLSGLYMPTSGTVSWDGVSITDLSPAALHDRVAVVFQEPVRWPISAEDNVRIGRLDRTDPDGSILRDVLDRAGAAAVFADLPDGAATVLSRAFQHGRDLSGGQWQRISVARGLYRDADVVVADEPTAALDARAEAAVFTALRAMSAQRAGGPGRIVVLVTHRLANIRHADRIVVLDKGDLIEQGTHEELMAAGGSYQQMFRLQSRMYGLEIDRQPT